MLIEKILEFFVEYLLIATIMTVSLGIGWVLGLKMQQTIATATLEKIHQEAVAAGVGRYDSQNKTFEWVAPTQCHEE